MRKIVLVSLLFLCPLVLAYAFQTPSTPAPAALDLGAGAKLLTDPAASRAALGENAAEYAWSLFLALNEPLQKDGPKVWETSFRQTSTIYLADGAKPAPWGSAGDPPDLPPVPADNPCVPAGVRHNLDTAIQVDGLVLLDNWNQDVRYQLLMNQAAFDYIVQRGFYNVNGQEKAAQANQPADFPPEAFELKTSWIWLGTDPDRCSALKNSYYIVNAYYELFDRDGRPAGWANGYAALAGMHIINKALPTWVWITFENINNKNSTHARLELPIDPATQAANAKFQSALREAGSIFANYQLDGVQTTFTQPGTQPNTQTPTLLANSTIESAFQTQSSCSTCHSLASISPSGQYFNIVSTQGGNVGYYVGNPPETKGFTSLDFVWSMKRASREKQ